MDLGGHRILVKVGKWKGKKTSPPPTPYPCTRHTKPQECPHLGPPLLKGHLPKKTRGVPSDRGRRPTYRRSTVKSSEPNTSPKTGLDAQRSGTQTKDRGLTYPGNFGTRSRGLRPLSRGTWGRRHKQVKSLNVKSSKNWWLPKRKKRRSVYA